MDILNAQIWETIQAYLPDDFEDREALSRSLQKLKNDFPKYYTQVLELLDYQEPATRFFSQLSNEIVDSVQEDHFATGYCIGSYKIEKLLATGSMSDVYRATRWDGEFDQEVAIKVLKEHIDSPWMKEQFQHEKQILASLHHPNIAGIYDGGITPEGKPYIIMEYIDGEPVTRYCDRKRLTIQQRLALFSTICQAVNYAHQNLVIHKDLKPGNILVDSNGYVKLMDFGIAQLTGQRRTEERPVHAFTPQYASPEQLKRRTLTTASDIYQLGLVLCRILTGFHFQQLPNAQEVHQFIFPEEEQAKPEYAELLANRELRSFRQLKYQLRGDPEAIVLKALAPQPKERYPSAEAMHHDIDNYFRNQPIHAREKTYGYLVDKFIKRNKRLLQLALAFLILLATLTTAYFLRLNKARKVAEANAQEALMEARRSENMTHYLKNIFSMADPYVNPEGEVSVDVLINQSYQKLLATKGMDSLTRADMLTIMADVFRNRGDYQKNRDAVRRAATIKCKIYTPKHPELGQSYRQIAETFLLTKEIDSAAWYINKALQIDSINENLSTQAHLKNIEVQGDVFYYQADYASALQHFRLVYEKSKHHDLIQSFRMGELLSYIGDTYHQLGSYDSAKVYLRKAIEMHKNREQLTAYLVDSYTALAATHLRTEELDSAAHLIQEAISLGEQFYGEVSGELEYPLAIASRIAKKKNNYNKALNYAHRALAINQEVFGEHHFFTAQRLNTVGLVHRDFGQPEKAARYFLQAVNIKEQFYPNETKSIYISKYNYAVTLLSLFETRKAIQILEEVKEVDKQIYPKGHVYAAYTFIQLGRGYLDISELKKAGKYLQRARESIEAGLDSTHTRRGDVYRLLTWYHLKQQQYVKALACAKTAQSIYSEAYGEAYWKTIYSHALVALAVSTEQNTDGQQLRRYIEQLQDLPFVTAYYIEQLETYGRQHDLR